MLRSLKSDLAARIADAVRDLYDLELDATPEQLARMAESLRRAFFTDMARRRWSKR